MGAYSVLGVDIDQNALDTAWINLKKLEIESVDLLLSNVVTTQFSLGYNIFILC